MLSDDEIWSRWKFPADWSWKQSVINFARAIEREARRQALEEAARVCDSVADKYQERDDAKWPEMKSDAQTGANSCADAIRALKEQS